MCAALASNNRRAVAILASPEHRRRCSLRRKNRAGLSPLYVACKSPSADLLRVLLEADPSLIADCSKPSAGTSDGLSLFFHALKSGAWDAAACMAENGVTLTLSERDDPFVLRKVFGRGAGEDDDDRGRQQIVSRGFSNAMRHLLVSQIMCDTFVVGGDRDGKTWQIGAHSFVLPERMLKAPHRTSRSVAMTALIYWYSGQFVEERCDNEELAKLALAWKLPNHYRVARIDSKKTNTQSFVYGKPPHLTMKTISSDCFDAAELRKRKGKHRDALLAARSPFYAAMLKWNDGSVVWDAPKELVGSLLDHVHGNPVVDKSRPVSTTLLVQLAYFADMYIFSDLKDEVDAILASRAEKYREEDLFAIFETAHAITLKRTMRVFLKFALFDKAGLDHLSGKQNGTFSRMSADSTANMTKNELVALILRACQQTIS